MKVVQVQITSEMRQRIVSQGKSRGSRLNTRTILSDGEANNGGFGGEEIVKAYLPFLTNAPTANNEYYNYDFLLPNGMTLDVKSKGNNKYYPTVDFDCTIPDNQRNQKTDFYVFTRISPDLDVGWICGIIKKKNFWNIAKLRQKGEAYNNVGRKTLQSVYYCQVKDLMPIDIIKDYYEINSNL